MKRAQSGRFGGLFAIKRFGLTVPQTGLSDPPPAADWVELPVHLTCVPKRIAWTAETAGHLLLPFEKDIGFRLTQCLSFVLDKSVQQ